MLIIRYDKKVKKILYDKYISILINKDYDVMRNSSSVSYNCTFKDKKNCLSYI